jgi:uncharacterized protein (TIRG00374 family)
MTQSGSLSFDHSKDANMSRRSLKRRVLFTLKLMVAMGLLGFLFSHVNLAQLLNIAGNTRFDWFGLAFLCFAAGQLFQAARWKIILDESDFRVSFRRLFAIHMVGTFFNNFMPSSIGGDLFKALYIGETRDYGKVMSATLLTRYLGLSCILILGLFSAPFAAAALRSQPWWKLFTLITATSAVGSVALLFPGVDRFAFSSLRYFRFPERIVKFIDGLIEPIRAWRGSASSIVSTAILSILFIAIGFSLVTYFSAISINEQIPLASIIVIAAISALASALPISVNGLGVTEGTFVYLLGLLGTSHEKGFMLALLLRGMLAAQGVAGGVIYLFLKRSTAGRQ